MPFESTVDANRRLVITAGTGDLTGDQSIACCQQLKDWADFDPTFNQLIDLTHATRFDATPSDLKRLADQSVFSPGSRRAIVATDSTIFGFARMFESYRSLSDDSEQIVVFRELREALQWLDGK